jgi:Rieske Fe-S protein
LQLPPSEVSVPAPSTDRRRSLSHPQQALAKHPARPFSSICTHQGCQVDAVTTTINCPCHGSKYSITDGSVVNPPAPKPLPEKTIKVEGDNLVVT